MRKRHFLGLLALPPALWAVHRFKGLQQATPNPLQGLLGGEAGPEFRRVTGPEPFDFPTDHAAHPDFRHEWWYFTGNLQGNDQRQFGFQLTFFRFAVQPRERASTSAWNTRQAMLGHFALTDVQQQRFLPEQRLERPALGIAGMSHSPANVWMRDWRARHHSQHQETWELEAHAPSQGLKLMLSPAKAYVGQGAHGFSRKGPGPGNASRYYSATRLVAKGQITLMDDQHDVTGLAWLDREWGTSALAAGTRGWDWFGLQLDDGTDLMVYLLRQEDGKPSRFSAGSLVRADGGIIALDVSDLSLEVLDTWISPRGGRRYPAGWRLRIDKLALDLRITPRVADQEWLGFVRYWEGSVHLAGTHAGRAVTGLGYTELTGY